MITADMRKYDYYTYGAYDDYGQPILSPDIKGKVKMAIYIASQSIQDNVLFENCAYVGITNDTAINSTYVIAYGTERLKVLYVNTQGRYKQCYMARV